MNQSQFEVAFYKWALVDLEREINEGFPLIGGFRSSSVVGLQKYVRGLDMAAVGQLVHGLVGRSHTSALSVLQLSVGDAEGARVAEYLGVCSSGSDGDSAPVSKELRTKLRKMIPQVFSEGECGDIVDSKSGVYVLEKLIDNKWRIRTHIDSGIRGADVAYINAIRSVDGGRIEKGTSILEWMGIRGQSEWIGYAPDEADVLLGSLKSVVRHYVKAMVPLLRGVEGTQ